MQLCCRLTVTQPRNTPLPIFTPHDGEQIRDMFQGVGFSWTHFGRQQQQQQPQRRQYRAGMGSNYPRNGQLPPPNNYFEDGPKSPAIFQLTALRKLVNRNLLRAYLQHVKTTALEIQRRSSELQVGSSRLMLQYQASRIHSHCLPAHAWHAEQGVSF